MKNDSTSGYLRRLERSIRKGRKDILGMLSRSPYSPELEKKEGRWDYPAWVGHFDTLTESDRGGIKEWIEALQNPPLISILMPIWHADPDRLNESIWSVRKQLYPHFELCIADDSLADPGIREVLAGHAAGDERVKVTYCQDRSLVCRASNSALEMATGGFAALLEQGDLLSEHALFWVAEAIQQYPHAGLLYSDEDVMDTQGVRKNPYFKCDWNPFLFLGHNLIGHLGVYCTALVRELGGFRTGYEGSHDYDLAARAIEKLRSDQIIHIPRILYHQRGPAEGMPDSTANECHAGACCEKTINEHLRRMVMPASAEYIPKYHANRVTFDPPVNSPLVSILIPTRNAEKLVRQCIESIVDKTTYSNYEILLIDNGSDSPAALSYFKYLERARNIHVMRDDGPFNYSRLNNKAAEVAKGEVLLLLNNDTEVVAPDWLTEMVAIALIPSVGAVGARLWYPNHTLQHGGVIIGLHGVANHSHRGMAREDPGYYGRCQLLQMYSAVTGACMAVRKKVYFEVGGLDEKALKVAFNDIDLCLKLREKGYWNVWTPNADLLHHESVSRGAEDTPEKIRRANNEICYMKKRWPNTFYHDPAYNPNLTYEEEDFSYSTRPRVTLGSSHQPEIIPGGGLTIGKSAKPRVLLVVTEAGTASARHVQSLAQSMINQGLIDSYTLADKSGLVTVSPTFRYGFDAIWVCGIPYGNKWFERSVIGHLPYLVALTGPIESISHGFFTDRRIKRAAAVLPELLLRHSARVAVANVGLLEQLEATTGLELKYCTDLIPGHESADPTHAQQALDSLVRDCWFPSLQRAFLANPLSPSIIH